MDKSTKLFFAVMVNFIFSFVVYIILDNIDSSHKIIDMCEDYCEFYNADYAIRGASCTCHDEKDQVSMTPDWDHVESLLYKLKNNGINLDRRLVCKTRRDHINEIVQQTTDAGTGDAQ